MEGEDFIPQGIRPMVALLRIPIVRLNFKFLKFTPSRPPLCH